MSEAADIHNRVVGPALKLLVKGIGPKPVQLLIVAESLVVGLFLVIVRLGGDEPVVDVFAARLKERLAEQRLKDITPKGTA